MTCTIDDCEAKASARGWCPKHYARWSRTGDPTLVVAPKKYAGKTFDELVDRSGGPDACWPWQGYINKGDGYGRYRRPGERNQTTAHIVAYEAAKGPRPEGRFLDHRCHEPATCDGGPQCQHRRCCNPSHLKPVTHQENNSAMRKSPPRRGPKDGSKQLKLW